MRLDEFTRLPRVVRVSVLDGLAGAIDTVAERAPPAHRFLRYQWFAAALSAYGGDVRTLLVEQGGAPVIALPLTRFGPGAARLAAVPGCYWPFRSFPIDQQVEPRAVDALLD
ncbi:MAG: GNAT family N-acetyltransferase, partial [Pseudomonadota bacterium]|nr:GNAT family N-acetyltransferase [Pseudomonadota bacterium]